ncbi:palmitoyltransferase ZDHHC11-like, partial [Oncorhynchus nerka]|uniref:palmitoyltransferase ZDHHC11-like n=1 Tax=Oncorhynchus nerka TaxID=8023 RepID=UPI0031B86E60
FTSEFISAPQFTSEFSSTPQFTSEFSSTQQFTSEFSSTPQFTSEFSSTPQFTSEFSSAPQFTSVMSNGTLLVFLSVGVMSNGTWLVFLPLAPMETGSGSLLVVAFLTVMLATGSLLLLVHLLGFHIYLLLNKMSTYDYIITRRRKQASQQDIEMGFPQSSDSNAEQNHPQMEPSIDCDALLSDRVR